MKDCKKKKNNKLQHLLSFNEREPAPAFRTSFWAVSPAWPERLTCKRRLTDFKTQVFPPAFF